MKDFDFGILGINGRNLNYIKEFNPRKGIRLADNKFKTKEFLSQRGIPVPQTFGMIKNRAELYSFDFSNLPSREFVVKPNKGSKGKGILITNVLDKLENKDLFVQTKTNFLDKMLNFGFKSDFQHFYKIGKNIYDDDYFRRYLTDILDAKYSLTMGQDKILIEEKLKPGETFKGFCKYGLADIRVIVFNLIPVAAMVRVPTQQSGGKANLAQGGVGLGIEVGSGRIKTMLYKKRVFKNAFPGAYESFYNKKIQFWNDVLLYSSRIQYFVNLGYLALDWVITDEGPKLLEMNARAGLELQNASLLPLKKRLEKIGDMKIQDPEKGVEIAKTLFNKTKSPIDVSSKVIYLSQKGNLTVNGSQETINDIIVKVDLTKKKNYISDNLFKKIDDKKINLEFLDTDLIIKNLTLKPSTKIGNYELILGKELLSDYYVKPINKVISSVNIISSSKINENEIESLHLLDQKIISISRDLNLSTYLKPVNYLEQLDNFIAHKGSYNPIFKYRWPKNDKINYLFNCLDELKERYFGQFKLKSSFANLFDFKINELIYKLELLRAYKKQDYDNIAKYSTKLYGDFDLDLLQIVKDRLENKHNFDVDNWGKPLTISETKQYILNYLKERQISNVDVVINYSNISRISIQRGKKIQIKLSSNANFKELELKSTLAHEIDVHLVRYLNGLKTGWNLFTSGTAGYIKDEEGLAIYKSLEILPHGYEKNGMYYKYLFANKLKNMDFITAKDFIYSSMKTNRTLGGLFKSTLRFYQGIQDTSTIGTQVYIKDKIYLEGYYDVVKWIEKGGKVDDLMVGKISISDLVYLK